LSAGLSRFANQQAYPTKEIYQRLVPPSNKQFYSFNEYKAEHSAFRVFE
jgi:hypothetical protein